TLKGVRDYCIKHQKPYLIECMTFRMRGHEEASGVKYVPKEMFEAWGKLDPVKNYESWLLQEKLITAQEAELVKSNAKTYIDTELKRAFEEGTIEVSSATEIRDMYKTRPVDTSISILDNAEPQDPYQDNGHPEMKFIGAISAALRMQMEKQDNLILMGQDIAEYGGAFKVTEGFLKDFGKARVRNTPLCESAIV